MRSLVLLLALSGCFQSIKPEAEPDAAPDPDAVFVGPFATVQKSDGSYLTRVDATSESEWTHGDFETGMPLTAGEPWDLRFQRFHISTNGGTSGSGGVEVAPIPNVIFDEVFTAPAAGWIADTAEAFAFDQGEGWYDYDMMTHALTPKPMIWVVRTNGGSTIKLEIAGYYDEAGTAGWFTLHWSAL
jgi:hypothetical protein